ncbi:MAG: pyrroline-5-carboxylate reductase [Actinobacteria bacterium]|nr:pyrroline-5-carboxylate reductase [Actinomycetota bacterium]
MGIRLAVVGGGRMGEALIGGLLSSGWGSSDELCVVEKVPARREQLSGRFPGLAVVGEVVPADGVVLAVKPGDVAAACAEVAASGPRRVLSIAAGVTLGTLEAALGEVAVVRAMPNTAALVGAGAAAISPGVRADEDDLAWAEEILTAVGEVVRVPESLLDAVTGLSGSGPAYVFLLAESLIDAGVHVGLPHDTSRRLALQTLLGAARLLTETGESPQALRAAVTSPAGTTAAGLRALESAGTRGAVIDAVVAATARSRELGASPTTPPSPTVPTGLQ